MISICFGLSFFGCTSKKAVHQLRYSRWVGDIALDASIDKNTSFEICNGEDNILQYFNLGEGPVYIEEKPKLINTFKTKYKPVSGKNQNGLIRIRFIVNCEGQAGRFRILQADTNFKETQFNRKIITQLTTITKEIENWVILYEDQQAVDYYYYLIFRITDGQITEILP